MPTHYQGSAEEVRALNTFIKFTRAYESLMARMHQRGQMGNLTVSQFGVLETLHHLGPMCQGEISGKLLKSCGNMTLVLDNLEKRGLVRRTRDSQDRRSVTVNLTEAGESLITEIFPQQVTVIVEEMNALTPQEQDTLGLLCKKLGKHS